jgi:two-component system response regulator AtoC
MLARVILAVDNPPLRTKLRRLISQPDVIVETLRQRGLLWDRITRMSCDLIVVSRSLVPDPAPDAISLLRHMPDAPGVVIISDHEDPEERANFLVAGCDSVVFTALSNEKLRDVLAAILSKRREQAQKGLAARRHLAQPRLTDFVSSSAAMQSFMTLVRRVVASDVSLLILGETGVGKERLARAIHAESSRSDGPFVAINCGALPESLLESELFGHEEGSFTGATRARRGWFELAHRGTVFLDEIGEMPHHLQVKLLRVLQDHEVLRVGSEKPITVDVRIMAATNRELAQEVEARLFRRDLYYRLSVVTLTVPPLRDRREDIPALVDSYINYLRLRIGSAATGITPDALHALCRYHWPGNVRELINVIERGMLLCGGKEITINDLPESVSGRHVAPFAPMLSLATRDDGEVVPQEWLAKPLSEVREAVLVNFERAYLAGLLHSTGGRIGETARRAGIQPRSLFDKMKRHGLRKEDFRPERTQQP